MNNTFKDLVINYNNESRDTTTNTYTKALTDLATAVTYAVLKKVITTTQNPTLIKARQELTVDLAMLDRLYYSSNNATELTFTTSGKPVATVIDTDYYNAVNNLCRRSLGDGLDLLQEAICSILEQTAKQKERDPKKPTDLERPFIIRSLNRKVWIKDAESVGGWEDKETTPIQEIFKTIRRAINNSRAVQTDPRNGYSYIEDIATDIDSGTSEKIYIRLDKYADFGGYVYDFNGKATVYTTDPTAVDITDHLVAKMNLSAREMQVLKLRQRGYGYKAIATYLGLKQGNIQTMLKRIQAKAIKIGLTPTDLER